MKTGNLSRMKSALAVMPHRRHLCRSALSRLLEEQSCSSSGSLAVADPSPSRSVPRDGRAGAALQEGRHARRSSSYIPQRYRPGTQPPRAPWVCKEALHHLRGFLVVPRSPAPLLVAESSKSRCDRPSKSDYNGRVPSVMPHREPHSQRDDETTQVDQPEATKEFTQPLHERSISSSAPTPGVGVSPRKTIALG